MACPTALQGLTPTRHDILKMSISMGMRLLMHISTTHTQRVYPGKNSRTHDLSAFPTGFLNGLIARPQASAVPRVVVMNVY